MMGGTMNMFFHRTNLSIALICMVNHTAVHEQNDLKVHSEVNTTHIDVVSRGDRNIYYDYLWKQNEIICLYLVCTMFTRFEKKQL